MIREGRLDGVNDHLFRFQVRIGDQIVGLLASYLDAIAEIAGNHVATLSSRTQGDFHFRIGHIISHQLGDIRGVLNDRIVDCIFTSWRFEGRT